MKRILHIFPYGVIIWPENIQDSERYCFTNKEFDTNFAKIKKDLDQLRNIDIIVNDPYEQDVSNSIKTDLNRFLKEHHNRLKEGEILVEHNAKIFCRPDLAHNQLILEGQEIVIERVCNIKTMTVEWEGVKSYMHVFIDNSDIIKLEEAKNNIKCQKIMFASASHEFRTPLNAIMNSFEFIDSSYRLMSQLIDPLINLDQVQREQKRQFADRINKYLKIGLNSSILLLSLIEDILDLSKMEAGTFKINENSFLLTEFFEEVMSIFQMQ